MAIVKTTLSLTEHDRKWMAGLIATGEYVSNSEYIRNLIRRDKEQRVETPAEVAYIRNRIIKAEQSGFSELSRDEILRKSKNELRQKKEL